VLWRCGPRRSGSSGVFAAEPLADLVPVESEPPLRSPKPDRPQVLGMGVDPIALDPKLAGEGGGVDKPYRLFL
jgi:hypothetical protein